METLRQTAEAARLSPIQESLRLFAKEQAPQHEALLRSFADDNSYTRHLDAVRSAVTLAITPEMQNMISLAAVGLPDWLKPAAPSDMLLPSWHRTFGIGAAGVAGPALMRDVLRSLHRDRPETMAFIASGTSKGGWRKCAYMHAAASHSTWRETSLKSAVSLHPFATQAGALSRHSAFPAPCST